MTIINDKKNIFYADKFIIGVYVKLIRDEERKALSSESIMDVLEANELALTNYSRIF